MVSTSLLYLGLNGEQQQAQQPMCKQKKRTINQTWPFEIFYLFVKNFSFVSFHYEINKHTKKGKAKKNINENNTNTKNYIYSK